MNLKRLVVALALAGSVVCAPLYTWKIATKKDYSDFDVYHRAASRVASSSWADVYNFELDGASPFRYAPSTLVLFEPFAKLPLKESRVLWFWLQALFYGAGFFLLHRIVRSYRNDSVWIVCLGFLFVLRFCIDSFTIGQVTGLMFFSLCLSLWGWVRGRPGVAAAALFVPTLFKVGTGLLYGLGLSWRPRFFWRVAVGAILTAGLWWSFAEWQVHGFSQTGFLWPKWWQILKSDSVYFDAAHYGSQSIKSALLRMAGAGGREGASTLWLAITGAGSLSVLVFWFFRTPMTPRGTGLFFSLGIFGYLWFMPETFKYSQPLLAVPVVMLLSGPLTRSGGFAVAFGFATLSLAGLDIVGATLFFGIQKASIPLLASLLLGVETVRQALRESQSIRWKAIGNLRLRLSPWETSPLKKADLDATLIVPLPLDTLGDLDKGLLRCCLDGVCAELEGRTFEVLFVPYGSDSDRTVALADELLLKFESRAPGRARLLRLPIAGASAAIREGIIHSRGSLIHVMNPEAPCDPVFFRDAMRLIAEGFDLVRANRRLPQSRFRIPVRLLPLVWKRHRMGLRYNRLIRWFFPVLITTDTQAGIFVMKRELALCAAAQQYFPFVMGKLEISLTAAANGYRSAELPVVLSMEIEKKWSRIIFEILVIAQALPVLAKRYKKGCYHRLPVLEKVTADDWGLSPSVNHAILDLAQKGVIRRVSIMAGQRHVAEKLAELKAVPGISLGLHFNLTHGQGLRGPGGQLLFWMIRTGVARRTLIEKVRLSLEVQLAGLSALGVRPDYLDGHHHIHLLPGLVDGVADILKREGIKGVRLPYDPALWLTGKFPILLLSLWARRSLVRHGFSFSRFVYPLTADFRDPGRLRTRLACHAASEVICHPATGRDAALVAENDSYIDGRLLEYQALRMLGAEWP